ncbi:unnamed protein product [Tilletia controversa]|uniref:Elongation factor Ts, mitochondrial n=3 Tax=Tilletia TaxID=13289 RepID=A0A8X7T0T5_9BASI|nr:hypothetical protein CF336_g729 [Tilletia laevis]KAE8205097.1 hypothetical protein CF328_g692 [Tilletia controversa]KAE8265235.1 hypothetical protein A4X03_0g405 [Tilletia caries]KAE8208529.1 hypothetical protein CF335_g341 [Tilletia laevis]KAE8254715.1 hypothetical protein A4X06_0g765 [Tilletia controversa]
MAAAAFASGSARLLARRAVQPTNTLAASTASCWQRTTSAPAPAPAPALHTRTFSLSHSRHTTPPKKPEIKSIAALRQAIPGTSMLKAREALLATRSPEAPDTDNVEAALAWLEEDRRKSGASKSEKVAGRTAAEGLVGVCVLADGLVPSSSSSTKQSGGASPLPQAAIVELNCETDFVGRNEVFGQLVRDITHTAALFPVLAGFVPPTSDPTSSSPSMVELPIQDLLQFPLLSSSADSQPVESESVKTISAAIMDTVARLGEKITLSRAAALVSPTTPAPTAPRRSESGSAAGSEVAHLASAYAHGGPSLISGQQASSATAAGQGYSLTSGRVASLLLTRIASPDLPSQLTQVQGTTTPPSLHIAARALARSLARQVAGMETRSIHPGPEDVVSLDGPPRTALYAQPFAMLLAAAAPQPDSASHSVADVLRAWGESKGLGQAAVEVQSLQRWEVGENVEREAKSADGFAEEVRKAAGL